MFYIIGEKSGISEEHIEWYKYFKGEEKTYQEWCRIFKGNLKIHAARDASMHTLGNYKARNAVISILTKNDLLNVYFKDGLEKIIQIIQDDKKILNDFKILYEKMTNQLIPSDVDVIDFFKEKFELSIPIIKGFKQLGTGDKDLVGKKVNRGDSENILDSMNLSDVKKKENGEYKYNERVKFPGVTSTSIGDDPAQNQYAKNSAVVWILTIGEKHHGFDFKKYVGEGYGSESEITFPMGVEVDIHLINIGKQENLKAKYVIQGTIY